LVKFFYSSANSFKVLISAISSFLKFGLVWKFYAFLKFKVIIWIFLSFRYLNKLNYTTDED